MPKKKIFGEFEGDFLSVENTWLDGAKLFHNNQLIASNNDIFALNKSKPIMSAKIVIDGAERLIEVFAYALLTVKIKIVVDGKQLAGDDF